MTWNILVSHFPPFSISVLFVQLVFSVRSLDILRARLSDWGIMIYAEFRGEKNNLRHASLSQALCSHVFFFFIPSYLLEIERYIPSKPFWSFPLSSKILLISDSMSCLIFQTSRWPFQRTNKVLKMQVLSSCERQLGLSPLLFQSSHRGVCATNKFKAVRQMHRGW